MKRRVPYLASVLVCVAGFGLLVAACGGGDSSESATTAEAPATEVATTEAPATTEAAATSEPAGTEAASGEPIVIGVAAGLSGDLAPWGLWPMRMSEFAVEDINAAGGVLGRPLKIVSADDKSNFAANGAATADEVLNKGAVVVVTSCDFDWSAPAQSEAQAKAIPAISFCAGAPQFGENGLGPLTFSNGIATPNEAAVPGEWAYNDKGWRNAFLLNDPVIDYDTTYCKSFGAAWEQLGGTVVGEDTFEQADPQLGSVITRFQSLDPQPDFIVLCSIPPGGATAIRQFRSAGIETPIIMNIGMSGDWWFESIGAPLNNAYQDSYGSWAGDDEIPEFNDLSARYQEKYGEGVPLPHTFMGYQVVQVIADAINRAGSTDPAAIAEALKSTDGDFLIGRETFEPGYNQSFTMPVAILEIQNGKAKFVTRRQPTIDTVALWEQIK